MKNLYKLLAIIALVAVIGFSMAACDDGSTGGSGGGGGGGGGGGSSSGGTFTVTDIPSELEGKDLRAWAHRNSYYSDDYITCGGTVKNRRMSATMWDGDSYEKYTGNETFVVYVEFWANTGNGDDNIGRGYKSVKFSNGSATVSWNQGLPTVNSWPVGWEW
jgi:hypothetical protein